MKNLNYKKKLFVVGMICLTILVINFNSFVLFANAQQSPDDVYDTIINDETINDQLEMFDTSEIFNALPDNVKKIMQKYDLDELSFRSLGQMNFIDFLNIILSLLQIEITKPFKTIFITIFLLILASVLDSYKTNFNSKSLSSVFSVVTVLVILTAISLPINECITNAQKTIESSKNFMLCFVPIFTGVLSVSGQTITASAYSIIMFILSELTSTFILTGLVPFLNIYLALCMVGGMNSGFNLMSTAEFIRKSINYVLVFTTTIFIGFWGLQTMVTSSADTVAMKTTKLAVSSFIPIVGGALSDTLNSVTSCLALVKSTIGVIAIIGLVFTYLPSILSCAAFLAATSLSSSFAQMLGNDKISNIFKSVSNVLKILISIILCYMLLIVVSLTIILSIGKVT